MTLWESEFTPKHVYKLTLHYLNSGIHAEIFLDREAHFESIGDRAAAPSGRALADKLTDMASEISWLHKVSVWFD